MNESLQDTLQRLAQALGTSERKKLLRSIGRTLRRNTAHRMRQQRDPDGQAWIKRQRGNQAMFRRLSRPAFLKEKIDAQRLKLGWFGRVGSIAAQHHHGGHYRLEGQHYRYPSRPLLALTAADQVEIQSLITRHLQEAL